MSIDDPAADKGGHDDATRDDQPGGWHPADSDDAHLEHRNGAKIVIRKTAPPMMPTIDTPSLRHGDHYEVDFKPAGRDGLVPVVETGSKDGARHEAERFAALAPDGRPDVEMFADWVTEDQL